MKKIIILAVFTVVLFGCASIPKDVKVVHPFSQEKYLGKWYEIARKENRFEKNLDHITADYSLRADGKIKVVNGGFNVKKNKQTQVEGKAKFRGADTIGALKVSFFGPFYSGYNVMAVDDQYQYALVAGKSLDYLWLLSRKKIIPDSIRIEFLQKATNAGYDTTDLVWVKQN